MPPGYNNQFNEYYRCYPVVMLQGNEREKLNHGGKIFMPPSALEKLIRLHITYPMLFELTNGVAQTKTHAGVLEFIAEEGRAYLPYWIMQSLSLEPGDMLQIKSTDLPPGSFIKLQPQSTNFLEITDPKAVLEKAMRDFSCLTTGDIFSFSYNDTVYSIAVLESKPARAISVLETDLEVDFAPPVGYVEPSRSSGTSTPRSGRGGANSGAGPLRNEHGMLHSSGSMAAAINYSAIAPNSSTAVRGEKALSSNFQGQGQRLAAPKRSGRSGASGASPKSATPAPTVKEETGTPTAKNGPQPLRLPHGKLFFGYEHKAVKKVDETGEKKEDDGRFVGQGSNLRGKPAVKKAEQEKKDQGDDKDKGKTSGGGQRLGGGLSKSNNK
ncbi:MAG: ubiquitin fusion degradation protein [Vezdaea aestivalis]|nr:MAG: ubiquitin fusion degradation protein [Vezdaea aestivalis]